MFDALISGAGPVGLFFAYQLVSLGHTVYICDKGAGPTDQSRAILMTSRTLETLDNRGIAHHFLKHAIVAQGTQAFNQGYLIGTLDAVGDTTFPHMTCLPQHKTEAIFADLLQQKSLTIHRETTLESYTQSPNYIEATVKKADGSTQVIQAKYIIGADGSHSVVRKCTEGWTYEGYSVATRFAMADVVLQGKHVSTFMNSRVSAFSHPKGASAIIPLGRHVPKGPYYHRIVCNLEPYELEQHDSNTHGVMSETKVPLSQIHQIVSERIAPLQVIPSDPTWISLFRVNERKANGYRRRRALLIGDAAHCHSPVGGQGMNLGLQDADNLAWKLSLVLNGLSSDPDKLLDSYSIEREPIAAETLKATGSMTRVGFGYSYLLATIGYYVMSAIMAMERVRTFAMTQMMQLRVQIPKESPLLFPANKKSSLIQPGQYLFESGLLRKRILTDQLERRTIRDILRGCRAQHAIIWVGSRPSRRVKCPWTSDFWMKLKKSYSFKAVQPVIIESTWHTHDSYAPSYAEDESEESIDNIFWLEDHWDVYDSVSKRIGLTENMWDKPETPAAVVIVRPDMYVAHSALIRSATDIDLALAVLGTYLNKATA